MTSLLIMAKVLIKGHWSPLAFILVLANFTLMPSVGDAQTLDIWIKAFIPIYQIGSTPNYVRPVPGKPGKFMIPGPLSDQVPVIGSVPFLANTCYNTNDRMWSTDKTADAKLSLRIKIKIDNGAVTVLEAPSAEVGETLQFACSTGNITCQKRATANIAGVSQPRFDNGVVIFHLQGDAGNPCIAVPDDLKPSVKFDGDVRIDPTSGTIGFDGSVAQFPAYEMYLTVDGGEPQTIFQSIVNKSEAPDLRKNTDIHAVVRYKKSGVWENSDPRWRVSTNFGSGNPMWNVTMDNIHIRLQRDQQGKMVAAALEARMTERLVAGHVASVIPQNVHHFTVSSMRSVGNWMEVIFAGSPTNAPRTRAEFRGSILPDKISGVLFFKRTDQSSPLDWGVSILNMDIPKVGN